MTVIRYAASRYLEVTVKLSAVVEGLCLCLYVPRQEVRHLTTTHVLCVSTAFGIKVIQEL